ncbi:MAG: dihydrolipoyl dehydrogenase [Deltaproteobacteria bacterium]|nr:MAG: dihydrolipoyl dehydrogenase [Deltaproteobacteria bacterium]
MESQQKSFDLIVIGSGPAGYLPTILASRKGLSVAIIEKADLGGTCLNRGCIPSKALLNETFLWDAFSRSGLIKDENERLSYFHKAMERKEIAVSQVVSGLRNLLNRDRITVLQGEASFLTPRAVRIKKEGETDKEVKSNHILIASGAIPKGEPLLKIDGRSIVESDDLLKMTDLPTSLAIVGAGRRGVEFASFFNSFGVEVTLLEKESRVLPKMDREISIRYKGLLAKKGVKVLTETEAMAASVDRDRVNLEISQRGKAERLSVQRVLLVGNRRGNTDGLDLGKISLGLKDGFLEVDRRMKTTIPGIFAAGDVVGKGFLAHKAFQEGKTALENILGKDSQMDYRQIPVCLYSYPEAASVGLTEEEAKTEETEVDVGKFPFMACGQSIATGYQEGMVKIISEKKYGEILGVHFLGPHATELIHLGVMAMKHEIGVQDIRQSIFAHPTFSEAFYEAALDTSGEAIHMMKG